MDNTTEGKWDSLPVKLNDGITQTLNELGFTHMTPVQVLTFLYSFRLFHSHVIASYANKLDNE
jgi:preprotein translocase subunit SecF